MDTAAVAAAIGTTPRKLRQFLRSEGSTFQAVGSGARYDFTERDVPTINARFHEWSGTSPAARITLPRVPVRKPDQLIRDQEVWDEEDGERGGPLVIPDIRAPGVRQAVQRIAQAQEARLDARLLAVGLHITQMRVRAS
jgi:hypothetical protein